MKLIIGIVIGILIVMLIKPAYARNATWIISDGKLFVERITDGNINCYVISSKYSYPGNGISCVKK